jgi:hypothetical protein
MQWHHLVPDLGDTTMLTKTTMALAATLLVSSASIALAQYDGDGNLVPGAHQRGTLIERTPSFDNAFAGPRPVQIGQRQRQLDGDENPVPGSGR